MIDTHQRGSARCVGQPSSSKFVSASSRNQQAGSLRSPDHAATRQRGSALSFHSAERLLKELKVTRVAGFLTAAFDPFFFQRILGRTVALVEDGEDLSDGIKLNFEKA